MTSVIMLTGILVISMILDHFNRAETFNPDDMFQVIDPDKLKDINPDLLIVQADSQELLVTNLKIALSGLALRLFEITRLSMPITQPTCLGFGIVSQEAIMKQISDEWGLNSKTTMTVVFYVQK